MARKKAKTSRQKKVSFIFRAITESCCPRLVSSQGGEGGGQLPGAAGGGQFPEGTEKKVD